MTDMIRTVFKVLASLLAGLLLFSLLFAQTGQMFLWNAVSSAVETQWQRCSMSNGYVRSEVYERRFDQIHEYVG